MPNLLKKLSEIFENEEIKKLCGANNEDEDDNENISNNENEIELNKSSHSSLNQIKKNDSVVSLITLQNLRESLINENKKD